MRISDWSSDVCSSDLTRRIFGAGFLQGLLIAFHIRSADFFEFADRDMDEFGGLQHPGEAFRPQREILRRVLALLFKPVGQRPHGLRSRPSGLRSEEHTSELQSLMRISYAVFCLKK